MSWRQRRSSAATPTSTPSFASILRQLISYMMEDPRTITPALEIVFIAKSIERIGDHAKNIAEAVVQVVKGKDMRHASADEIRAEVPREGRAMMPSILVVEDEPAIVELFAVNLEHAGYEVREAADAEAGAAHAEERAARSGAPRLDAARPVGPGARPAAAGGRAHAPTCRSSCSPRAPRKPTRSPDSRPGRTTT